MKKLILSFALLLLVACAGGPASDFDREFFTDQLVSRSLVNVKSPAEADRRADILTQLANLADASTTSASSGKAMQVTIEVWAAKQDLTPEDQKVVGYLVRKMLPQGSDINLPMTTEQKRVIGVYTSTIRASVSSWRQRK